MKNRILVCVTAALLALPGASVWEGAASIAPGGDLPDEGYYAATNSFPRNTVVDILNLETGKSVRVIVAAGLETPGLLAVLSREAAGIIGLRPRSIGRIRMTQPSDPVAFSRFTEGLASNGDPDYDPRALVASDPGAAALLNEPSPAGEQSPAQAAASPPETEFPLSGSGDTRYDEIVDISDPYNTPAASAEDNALSNNDTPPLDDAPSWDDAPPWDGGIVREPDLVWVYEPEEAADGEAAEPEEIPEEWRISEGDEAPGAIVLPDPAETAAEEADIPETNIAPGWEPEGDLSIADEPDAAEPEAENAGEREYDYSLVPAEERPPEAYPDYTLPPEAEISSLPSGGEPGTEVPDESLFIPPIAEAAAAPEIPVEPEAPAAPSLFSVPLISGLERGKYYLQLGAFSRAETAESELNRIGKTYPLSIQNGGSVEKPIYRILVGPINLGESGALLQRFKSIGYNDAFVRSGS